MNPRALCFTVIRVSGRAGDRQRIVYRGAPGTAVRRFRRMATALRQGAVELVDHRGRQLGFESAPRLRTRW